VAVDKETYKIYGRKFDPDFEGAARRFRVRWPTGSPSAGRCG
jgi:hypothetical protein